MVDDPDPPDSDAITAERVRNIAPPTAMIRNGFPSAANAATYVGRPAACAGFTVALMSGRVTMICTQSPGIAIPASAWIGKATYGALGVKFA